VVILIVCLLTYQVLCMTTSIHPPRTVREGDIIPCPKVIRQPLAKPQFDVALLPPPGACRLTGLRTIPRTGPEQTDRKEEPGPDAVAEDADLV
jgi:hypothetical protein